ncbi:hypothetical protein EDEG_01411 [Edhazardia aedis USNM 41457]|uniref:N-acetylglucosaminylphosphatidylinositol deacetylase n=1 Tax=Edhazardia aedis (strain USNM 41457) TaxID=1003232 RepID=J9D973_EDHAE|nr:hypothetical protein EDEG_01411 [Edhazardia aedis USNM 41457]|eukprot:EJW04326.1 hypothetical protein EDEG_01411 [Edhazardia aedis USNM 41457]
MIFLPFYPLIFMFLIIIYTVILIIFIVKFILRFFISSNMSINGRILLVIAHPDDESMFFSPLLQCFHKRMKILCLSSGDFDGIGKIRKQEMLDLCKFCKINCTVLDCFKDGAFWEIDRIVEEIKKEEEFNFKTIITFDKKGVSGHLNHIACYEGVKKYAKIHHKESYFLLTYEKFFKYVWLSNFNIQKHYHVIKCASFLIGAKMLFHHKSQMLWFRYLYLIFSNYMFVNIYVKNIPQVNKKI